MAKKQSPKNASGSKPKELTLWEELATLYDNPEIFSDTTLPLTPIFHIVSLDPPDYPTVVEVQLTTNLYMALRENLFGMMRNVEGFEEGILQDYGAKDWEEAREKIAEDNEYLEGETEMYWFFVRHFPKLVVRLYNIALRISAVYALRQFASDPAERSETDKGVKQGLAKLIGELRADINQMLGTRQRGGSAGKLDVATRLSFHSWYDDLYSLTKTIKRHYDNVFMEFDESHKRNGYSRDQWREFWANHAQEMYGYEKAFVSLFAEGIGQSASEVAYGWMAHKTNYTVKYARRLVIESRKKATMKPHE